MRREDTSVQAGRGLTASGACCGSAAEGEVAVDAQAKDSYLKVKLSYKLAVFTGAVLSLSWFFEGTREIKEGLTFAHVAILLSGVVLTVVFIGIYSYWIYVEEKSKGNLKKRIELFERIYSRLRTGEETLLSTGKGEE